MLQLLGRMGRQGHRNDLRGRLEKLHRIFWSEISNWAADGSLLHPRPIFSLAKLSLYLKWALICVCVCVCILDNISLAHQSDFVCWTFQRHRVWDKRVRPQHPLCYLVPCTPSLCPVNANCPLPTNVKSMCLYFAFFFPILEISLLCFLSPPSGFYPNFIIFYTLMIMYKISCKTAFFRGSESFLQGIWGQLGSDKFITLLYKLGLLFTLTEPRSTSSVRGFCAALYSMLALPMGKSGDHKESAQG